jgi:hypothetical protein
VQCPGERDCIGALLGELFMIHRNSTFKWRLRRTGRPPVLVFPRGGYIVHADNVDNVDALAGVHMLDLSHCTFIRDVSAPGGAHTLKLSVCTPPRALISLKFLNKSTVTKIQRMHALPSEITHILISLM